MRMIGVATEFMNETYRRQIDAAAAETGFIAEYPGMEAIAETIGRYEVIFGHPAAELLKKAGALRWLCCEFAGMERYLPDDIWPRQDCLLTNSSGAYGPTISEHIIMVLLMLFKRMPEYQADLLERKWTRYAPIRSITGSHMVLLGTGDIGQNAARRLKALGASSVTGVCRSGRCDEPAFDRILPLSRLREALPQADALTLSLPGTAETQNLLSGELIALLPPQAVVINVGRGSTIDQAALADALQTGKIAGAALDVMTPEPLPADHPLWSCPNTIITPHCSGNMGLGLTCQLAVGLFCDNLRRYAAGQPLHNLIDRKKGY